MVDTGDPAAGLARSGAARFDPPEAAWTGSARLAFGFTLVELLVVIAIIGILVAMLLPAIQAAREAARRSQCMNHVKQLAIACMNHEDVHKHFPTGGWGTDWVGDADRGYGEEQPGSWLYNILPFIEEQTVHDMPSDGRGDGAPLQPQLDGAWKMVSVVIDVFHCPSRRPAMLYKIEAHHKDFARNAAPNPQPTDFYVGACDYAANAGDGTFLDSLGPRTWQEGYNKANTLWTLYLDKLGLQTTPTGARNWMLTGVMFQRSEVGTQHVVDGTSKTYLLGERYLNASNYMRDQPTSDGGSTVEGGDDWGWAWGYCDDNSRSGLKPPLVDFPNVSSKEIFGSAHPGGWHAAFCDGHVEAISYDIDLLLHQRNANRRDGEVN